MAVRTKKDIVTSIFVKSMFFTFLQHGHVSRHIKDDVDDTAKTGMFRDMFVINVSSLLLLI
jgi:hypothetical protein